jgi:hypothetical protein
MEMSMMKQTYYVSVGMMTFGGSFAKALGGALNNADEENRMKIKQTWPDLWAEYLVMGQHHIEQEKKYKAQEPQL